MVYGESGGQSARELRLCLFKGQSCGRWLESAGWEDQSMILLPAFTGAPALNKVYNLDALMLLKAMPSESVNCIITSPPYLWYNIHVPKYGGIMPDKKGHIQKDEHLSKRTEFKKGEHWRKEKPFWNHDWLYGEYVDKRRSAIDIANQFNVTEAAVLFWLKKLNISRRSMKEIRQTKHWGLSGEKNGMFGRMGAKNPHWKGGISPERQAVYSSREWAEAVKIVWKRDNHTCQRCGQAWTRAGTIVMHIHHIVGFEVKTLRTEPSNLMLLCEDCHIWIHSKKNVNHEFIKRK
jgi:hypothetical protein